MDLGAHFKGKKITMLGLGVLGRGVNVAAFLARHGADITVTDLKSAEDLAPSLKKLNGYNNIRFVLEGHHFSHFHDADMVIKAAGVPLDSPYIKEARKHSIPIEMDASLFAKYAPRDVAIVGVTGTRGKSTVAHLAHSILKTAGRRAFLAGNVRGVATLPLLEEVKGGDIVVLELDSWQLQGFGDAQLSPHVAVFTTFLRDHMSYYGGDMQKYFEDKAHIFAHQAKGDTLIAGAQAMEEIRNRFSGRIQSNIATAGADDLSPAWHVPLVGAHNRFNAGIAAAACRTFGIPEEHIKKGVETFLGVPGRLEFVCEIGGVQYCNDTTATTPEALSAALEALGGHTRGKVRQRRIVLIAGGADKCSRYEDAAKSIETHSKALILFEGTARKQIQEALPDVSKTPAVVVNNMHDAVVQAREFAESGDTVLLSPGAASFGMFENEFDRGDQFVSCVKTLSS